MKLRQGEVQTLSRGLCWPYITVSVAHTGVEESSEEGQKIQWTIPGNAELTAATAAAGNGQLIPGLEEGEVYLSSLDRQQEAIREEGHASSLLELLVSCCVFLQRNTTRGWHRRPCKAPRISTQYREEAGQGTGREGRVLQLEATSSALTHGLFNPHSSSRNKQRTA